MADWQRASSCSALGGSTVYIDSAHTKVCVLVLLSVYCLIVVVCVCGNSWEWGGRRGEQASEIERQLRELLEREGGRGGGGG